MPEMSSGTVEYPTLRIMNIKIVTRKQMSIRCPIVMKAEQRWNKCRTPRGKSLRTEPVVLQIALYEASNKTV